MLHWNSKIWTSLDLNWARRLLCIVFYRNLEKKNLNLLSTDVLKIMKLMFVYVNWYCWKNWIVSRKLSNMFHVWCNEISIIFRILEVLILFCCFFMYTRTTHNNQISFILANIAVSVHKYCSIKVTCFFWQDAPAM